jgi:hypothetical protein
MEADTQAAQYEIAYREAVRAIEHQDASLDELRSRAGVLIAATAIVTSFLGGQALDDADATCLSWIAMAFFAGAVIATGVVLLPVKGWRFVMEADRIVGDYIESSEGPLSAGKTYRELALRYAANHQTNEPKLERLQWAFRLGIGLLAMEVLFWILDLATRG